MCTPQLSRLTGSAVLGSPVDPQCGSSQWIILFSHRRGEYTGIWVLFIAVTKILRKKKGEKLVIVQDFKGFWSVVVV